ncbi:uncharacterized protein DUF262 [Terracoccus luteus]|uniref:Uncharacterized protein DUF262 n=1 Tax=Terracoccus luteus TaxID=53356 RepID=A0A495XXT2_9MICO|nr:DUF262 domain-containing protein [Terracoccus luteus]RKT79411.1 uncharacterized protein DUF262 [Terracoccus luteus]
MKGYPTSFVGMFRVLNADAPRVASIEIPLIQRDYAQGRPDAKYVRDMFLDSLYTAVTSGPPVGLDFVYGEVRHGKFEPLDGQQRLTTLFLLHWYLAFRTGTLEASHPWTHFTYATRPSARRFCEQLVANPPAADLAGPPSVWITDQSWYLHLWRFDPTVEAMLVMIDAIAARLADADPMAAWAALTDADDPAVWFQLLPVADMGAVDDLYIKMNSRGKPLTAFEAFKAHFGQVIEHTGRTAEFGELIDGPWTDLLWPYRGDNDIVDDEFMRFFDFILEVCEWREGRVRGDEQLRLERRAELLFSPANERHGEHLDFVFDAFNRWPKGRDLDTFFESLFTTAAHGSGVRLFGAPSPNLFLACCERFGAMRGNTRAFSLTDTLLLYAVLVHRIEGTDDPAQRLRVLRNANEASQFEMRLQNMPKFIYEVAEFMRVGDLAVLATYNQNQVADEARKQGFREQRPELAATVSRLEDHPILRGTMAAFELDEALPTRAETFEQAFAPSAWSRLTAALVATGPYQRDYPKSDYHLFGSPTAESVWRTLLVDRGDRASLSRTGGVVTQLLDDLAEGVGSTTQRMDEVISAFIERRGASADFDWRYYLARYDCMREGRSGIYYGADHALGYEMTMLDKTVQRSYYRDPYLYAIWREAGSPAEVKDPWFYGYSTTPRWMQFKRSGVGLRSIKAGIALKSGLDEYGRALELILDSRLDLVATEGGHVVVIPQKAVEGAVVDTRDRVQVGAELVIDLVAAGL